MKPDQFRHTHIRWYADRPGSPSHWRTFLSSRRCCGEMTAQECWLNQLEVAEGRGGSGALPAGPAQKFCCRRFLASMASRMGCRFDWYFCRISSISCSIMGSRARSLF